MSQQSSNIANTTNKGFWGFLRMIQPPQTHMTGDVMSGMLLLTNSHRITPHCFSRDASKFPQLLRSTDLHIL